MAGLDEHGTSAGSAGRVDAGAQFQEHFVGVVLVLRGGEIDGLAVDKEISQWMMAGLTARVMAVSMARNGATRIP
jgi:hypothetical protein